LKYHGYISRSFRVNEKNKEHWMTELRIAEPRLRTTNYGSQDSLDNLNPLIANVGQGSQNIELVQI